MTSVRQKIVKNFSKPFISFFPKKDALPFANTKKSLGITSLLCHRDVTMFIYGLHSLFYYLGYQLPVFIIDDGSLTEIDKKTLLDHFHAHIETTASADSKMKKLLKKRPSVLKYRFSDTNGKYKLKFDAVLLHPFERFILLDADVLFFSLPAQIKEWIEKEKNTYSYPSYNEHLFLTNNPVEFSLRTLIYRHLKVHLTKGFNSGILLFPERINKDIDLINRIFQFFDRMSLLEFDGLDDLFLALLFGKKKKRSALPEILYKVVFLCSELDLFLETGGAPVAIHFGWQSKGRFYEYAIQEAFRSHFFHKSS